MAFSPTLGVLMGLRAMLGLGESFNWPCALRATSAVLPASDRSLGNGIFNSGAAVGAILGPLVVPWLSKSYGWRPTFLMVGSLGLLWVFGWLWMVRGPSGRLLAGRGFVVKQLSDPKEDRPPRFSVELRWAIGGILGLSLVVAASFFWFGERSIWWAVACFMIGLLVVCRLLPERSLSGLDWAEALGEIVRFRRFQVLAVVSISINVCWGFLTFWLPTFWSGDRKFSPLMAGFLTALPFLAADLGNLGGGAISRFLAVRGLNTTTARVWVMAFACILICPGALVGGLRNTALVVGLIVLMAFGTAAFMANYFAFCQEVSAKHTGFVVGVLGGLGNLFVAGFLPLAGYVRDVSGSFGQIFVLVGLLPFVGLGALMFGWGQDVKVIDEGIGSVSDGSLR
jgi:ACS family hexuronate transporter-like MFS transporter